MRESYSKEEGFARVVQKTPAAINLDELPEGYGFGFEFKVKATNENVAKPILDRVEVSFD